MKRSFRTVGGLVCCARNELGRWLIGATGEQSNACPHRLRHDVDVLAARLDALEQNRTYTEDLLDLAARVQEWT